MRSTALRAAMLLLPWLAGCRAPAIPGEPSAPEYAAWHDVLLFQGQSTHPEAAVVIWPETLPLDERQLQFQRCLPRHMRNVFDSAPAATLSADVPEDWLRLATGQNAALGRGATAESIGETELLRFSRVAFSRFHRDGYVWLQDQRCVTTRQGTHCGERTGRLLRLRREDDRWAVEETDCSAISFGDDG